MDEEYEILPKNELEQLRREVEKIRKNPLGDSEKSKSLYDAIGDLTLSINKLLSLFENTQKELIQEYEKKKPNEALGDILDQNEKIAKGTLAVADMIKQQQEDINSIKQSMGPVSSIPEMPVKKKLDNKIPDMSKPFSVPEKENIPPPIPEKK
jgi:methyl-accepting chemotaxis protein